MQVPSFRSIFLIISLAVLGSGCASRGIPTAQYAQEQADAVALLQKSATAHGLDAWEKIQDISASYKGEWSGLVSKLQPVLIDAGFRQQSEERIILSQPLTIAQIHIGPEGSKQVTRSDRDIVVIYNGDSNNNSEKIAAAALVADGYRLFLTGPFYFLGGNHHLERAGSAEVNGRQCDSLLVIRRPGHGQSEEDHYLLYIDRENHLLRRVRFSMEGLESTRGAIAEVDFFDHQEIAGVIWPTRFYERLLKPIPYLSIHHWQLTGLDVNRGMTHDMLLVKDFKETRASAPAKPLNRD